MAISDRIVILRRGVVQQVGFPMDLYTHPRSIFVANFIGEATFLAGTIKERDDVGSSIELRGGDIVRVSDLTHRIGDLVTVGIRPELANLTRGEKETENALFGLVERRTFVGRFVYYSVRLDNGEIFLVKRRPETAPQVIDTKLRVTVSFSPDDAFVFAHPKEGLMAALEVD
jgi:iron(III) transport system ATP-binding protein